MRNFVQNQKLSDEFINRRSQNVEERESDEESEGSSDGRDDGREVEEERLLDDGHVDGRVENPECRRSFSLIVFVGKTKFRI
jgi:hypothetical protein